MRRDARTFSIWATIVQVGAGRYEVWITGLAVDVDGPEERFTETATANTLEEAIEKRISLVREVCERLEKAGSRVVLVELRPVDRI